MRWSAVVTVLVALFLGAAAFMLGRVIFGGQGGDVDLAEQSLRLEGDTASSLRWMRKSLSLSEEEFARVCALHDAYMDDCRHMSAEMDRVRDHLKDLLRDRSELDDTALAALKDYEVKHEACERAATEHLMRAAAVMDAESRRAYLEMMLPRLFPDHNRVLQKTLPTEGSH